MLGLAVSQLERTDAPIGAGDPWKTPSATGIGAGRFQCIAGELARPATAVSGMADAEPATNNEREPALPKPEPRSVSPWTMRIFSIGTPKTSTTSWA